LQNLIYSYQRNVIVIFVTLSLNKLWLRSDVNIISTPGFSLRVYKVHFCKSEKRILPLHTRITMKHARNVD